MCYNSGVHKILQVLFMSQEVLYMILKYFANLFFLYGLFFMTNEEIELVDNVALKLQVYMEKTQKTIFSLAKEMNIDRQPFYRILNKKNVPTITSLFTIAKNLSCSIQELISDHIFLDVQVYENVEKLSSISYRIYMSYEEYQALDSTRLFAIKKNNKLELYLNMDSFINDGLYIAKYRSKNIELQVLSTSSKFVIAGIDDQEQKISTEEISAVAKYYSTIPIVERSFGRKLTPILGELS